MGEKKRRLAAQQVQQARHAQQGDQNQAVGSEAALEDQTSLRLGTQCLQQGLQAHQQGRLQDAIAAYRLGRTHLQAPSSQLAQIRHYLGLALCQCGQSDQGLPLLMLALSESDGAAKLEPKLRAQFHFNVANALNEYRAGSDMLPHLQQAAQYDPNDQQYVMAYAQVLHARGETAAAIQQLQQLQERGAAKSSALDLLAQWLFQDNQLAAAKEAFAFAVHGNPALLKARRIGYAVPPNRALHDEQSVQQFTWQNLQFNQVKHTFTTEAQFEAWRQELDLHVVDNFLPDALHHRQQMLRLPFHALRYAGQNYPGRQTDGQECSYLMAAIAHIMGKPIKFISPDNGSCRISLQESVARSDIHVDNETGDSFRQYAGVLFLNLPDQCKGGTMFWRHRETGWVRRHDDETVHAAGFANFKSFQQRFLPHNLHASQFNELVTRRADWEMILQLPMVFNRLLIYRGDFFHSIGEVFGSKMDDGRLVQLFFFETVDQPPSA